MKIILVGNHTCGNRGDGAILRGLIDSIKKSNPEVSFDVISRHPISSSYLLDVNVSPDILFDNWKRNGKGIVSKIYRLIERRIGPNIAMGKIEKKGLWRFLPLPKQYKQFQEQLKEYDIVIQVGGSFFVDLYGTQQFEHALCAMMTNKPIYLIGHSVGPFQKKNFNKIANFIFNKVNALYLRENVSLELMKKSGISTSKCLQGSDTAWLVNNNDIHNPNYALSYWLDLISQNKVVAVTMRELAPFDQRLGISQHKYEEAFSKFIDKVIDKGFVVVAFSTCTGIESYHKDDRMIALTVKNLLKNKEKFHIIMDEFNDHEIGMLLRRCYLTVGTRLHSAIISMNFDTPAIAINYEHKSLGVMQQLDINELAVDVNDLITGDIIQRFDYVIDNYVSIKEKVITSVAKERDLGHKTISDTLQMSDR